MLISAQRPLLCALLLSLLSACGGGSQSSGQEDRHNDATDPLSVEAPVSEEATLARAAELNTASLAAAEKRAQAADAKGASSASSSSATALDKLTPGQIAPKSAYASGDIARKALAVGITAYRFYNGATGAHFYTVSEAERDHVRNNLSPPFNYEGEAFRVASAYSPGLSPVHRFYNTRNGVHFYTISEAERAHVAATLPHYTYEGVAYHASEVAGANLIPFHRFYVPSKGFHFYTASEEEKNSIIANLGATYRYEGVGYYVLDTQWNAEKLPHTGIPASSCYQAGSDALQVCSSAGTNALNPLQDGFIASLSLSRLDYGTVPNLMGGGSYSFSECVLDKVSGLVWEGKQPAEPRGGNTLFTNLGNGAVNDVSAHVATVNASRLCGFNDWRVPSRLELHSIVHYANPQAAVAIDTRFVNAYAGEHWTREADSRDSTRAWTVDFGVESGDGTSSTSPRNETKAVRLVRGSLQNVGASRYTFSTIAYPGDVANNVVNDAWTGLQWRRCEEGRSWNGTTCTGNPLMNRHEAMLAHAKEQRGWRMPNVKELASLTDLGIATGTRMDPVAFPGAAPANFWATTPFFDPSVFAWYVNTGDGQVRFSQRTGVFGMRLLRANYAFTD